MKVVVMGGAGDMGSEAVRDLASVAEVKKVTIADYNEKQGEKLAAQLSEKADFAFVDANSYETLVEAMQGNDVVLSCLGPFYKYEEKLVLAAIESKTNYVSICDDFDAIEKVMQLDAKVKNAGITVMPGMGWTPGMSNVLAAKGIQSMDKAKRVNIAWAGSSDDSKGLAVIKHTLHIFTGKITTFKDGKWKQITAGSGKEIVEFPKPLGKLPMYHVGHPEPVTIPHFVRGLEEVSLKGGLVPTYLNDLAITLAKLSLTNSSGKRDFVASFFHRLPPVILNLGGKGVSGLRVDIHGEKDGKPCHIFFTAADNMRRITGIPASIGAVMIGDKKIKKKGVVAPEIVIPPDEFIVELEKRDIKILVNQV